MSAIYINEPPVRKKRIQIEVILSDASGMRGAFFVRPGERIIDVLNDSRKFVPFEDSNGSVHILSKDNIVRVRPLDAVKQKEAAEFGLNES